MSDKYRSSLPSNSVRIIIKGADGSSPILSKDNERQDKRNANSFRPIFLEAGFISRASGSAYSEYQNTKVVCSVTGPRPIGAGETFANSGKLHCHFKHATFSRKDCRKGYLPDAEEKEISIIMEEALASCLCLEKYPKSRFDCFVNVLEDDGSVLPAAITAASLAFADAGIEMFDLPTACSAALLKKPQGNNVIVLDPSWEEQNQSIGLLTLVFSPSLTSITHLLQTGIFTTEELGEAMELCQDGCLKLYGMLQNTLVSKLAEEN